jgi:hypothetical protein
MMIEGKFQNQGGDRFARQMTHYTKWLLLSKLCNKGFLYIVTQKHMIRLSFRWGIRIHQTQKFEVSGKDRYFKFSHNNAIFSVVLCTQYFENFSSKTWSNSNKKVIFRISTLRSIRICRFRTKTEIVLDFWIARTLTCASISHGIFYYK